MFEFIGALILALLAGMAIQAVTNGILDRAVAGFRELIGGWRGDGWPRGVQEEDRDRPWGRGAVATVGPMVKALIEPATHAVATAHVRGKTRSR